MQRNAWGWGGRMALDQPRGAWVDEQACCMVVGPYCWSDPTAACMVLHGWMDGCLVRTGQDRRGRRRRRRGGEGAGCLICLIALDGRVDGEEEDVEK